MWETERQEQFGTEGSSTTSLYFALQESLLSYSKDSGTIFLSYSKDSVTSVSQLQ